MFKVLAAGVIALVLLTGCGSNGTRVGTITKKEFTPAHTETYLMAIPHTSCYSTGKTSNCTTSFTYLPMTRWVSDHWDFKLENCSEGDAVNDKGCKHGEVAVDETTYHQYQEGDYYDPKQSPHHN